MNYLIEKRWHLSIVDALYKLEELQEELDKSKDELDDLKNNIWM